MTTPASGWERLAQKVSAKLRHLKSVQRFRKLQPLAAEIDSPLVAGHIDLTHNDYLGLRSNSKFHHRCRQAITYLPPGAGASRLLGGDHPIFQQLEQAFADFKDVEASLYFTSGYAANEAVATCLALDDVNFFSDELNHASIIDGIRLAGLSRSRRSVYPHNDITALEKSLSISTAEVNIVFTESLFSMDGDFAPLRDIHSLCQNYRGVLVVDEAHATGVFGDQGKGLIDQLLGNHDNVISINTCGKALGCQGAFVAGPAWLKELLVNRARSFIYTTGPSPWSAAAVLESLAFVREMNREREHLKDLSDTLRRMLRARGFDLGNSESQIIPLIVGGDAKALQLQTSLETNGVLAKAVRPPTVPEGRSRVRLSLNAQMTKDHMETVLFTLQEGVHGV